MAKSMKSGSGKALSGPKTPFQKPLATRKIGGR